jgi:flagellar motor switch protein FliM
MPTAKPSDLPPSYQVLDPTLLGRPVHLLPQFAAQLGDDLTAAMRAPAARRYWGSYRLASVQFVRDPVPAQLSWLRTGGAGGNVAVALGRKLLLGLLDCRYGRRAAAPGPQPDPARERVTATEERLAAVLTQQLAGVLAHRIGTNLGGLGIDAAPPAFGAVTPGTTPAKGSWTIGVVLSEPQSGAEGRFWMALDGALLAAILQGLMPERGRVRAAAQAAEPLASTLQVRIDGRLVSKEITLAALFELQIGDVIPISVGRADVLLDGSRLFTAAVTEHKGQLCLTSFEDTE